MTEFSPRAWLCIERHAEQHVQQDLGHLLVVAEQRALIWSWSFCIGAALTMRSLSFCLGARRECPHRRGPVARVLAHRGQERDEVRAQVAEHREEQQAGHRHDQQRPGAHVAEAVAVLRWGSRGTGTR